MDEPPSLRSIRRALVLWTLLARTYRLTLHHTETHLTPHQLTAMEFDMLAHIAQQEQLTQHQLAGRLLVTEGNVTYQLSKLEARGLITRRASGRTKQLALTPQGRDLMDRTIPGQNHLHAQQFSRLTDQEQDTLIGLLHKVLASRP